MKLTRKEFKKVFTIKYNELCACAYSYIKDVDTSKDIVQEVFIDLWIKEVSYDNDKHISCMLYKCVRNKSLNYLKKKVNRVTVGLGDIKEEPTSHMNITVVKPKKKKNVVKNAINKLPDRCKSVVMLSLKGCKNQVVAERLGISVNTVKDHKKVGYSKLRGYLRDYV